MSWRSEHNPPAARATIESRWLRCPDGLDIETLIGSPVPDRGTAGVVLNPHGGPHARTTFEYRPEWQALQAHGFLVVGPNYRGSDGYGTIFLDASRFDLGGADLRDCLRALDEVSDAAAPEFIMGSSYGGFLVVRAIGTTSRFRAAVAQNAAADIWSLYGQSDIPGWVDWEYGGILGAAADRIHAGNPLENLKQASTPTLVPARRRRSSGSGRTRSPVARGAARARRADSICPLSARISPAS